MPLWSRRADPEGVRLRHPLVLLATAAVAAAAALAPGADADAQACGAGAHGSQGYAYAGYQSTSVAHGVRATITPLTRPTVSAGHVAGWVGVGGPGQGANGETAWLQVGIASLSGQPMTLYAEITRAGNGPVFVPVLPNVQVGESHKVAVLEMAKRPNHWRVWVDGSPVTEPVFLAGSGKGWQPIATAESWNGDRDVCNQFAFRFAGVGVTDASGGLWQAFVPGADFHDRGFAVRGLTQTAGAGQRTLAADGPAPYAFEAASV